MRSKADFLKYHLTCFIEWNTYMAVHFGILYWHLDDLNVLRQVLSSDTISDTKGNTHQTETGERIYYQLYCYLRLVRSDVIKAWLSKSFPDYEQRYEEEGYLYGLSTYIDGPQKRVREAPIAKYADLEEMRQKYE